MKLFQTIRKNLAILYFKQNETDSYSLLIQQHLSCFSKSALSLISLFAYLIWVAETVNELMFSIFLSAASLFILVSFASSVFKTTALYDFFDHIESSVTKSKHISFDCIDLVVENTNLLYSMITGPQWKKTACKSNLIAEKWSKIAYFFLVRVSLPGLLMPEALFSFYQYFTTDLGNEAFELSLPMW